MPAQSTSISSSELQQLFQNGVQRCSLIRNAFRIVSEGSSYEELAVRALHNKGFEDLMKDGANELSTWSVRLRKYSAGYEEAPGVKENSIGRLPVRYGKIVRSSMRDERKAIDRMADLVKLFRGEVNLTNPKCKIYLLEGMKQRTGSSRDEDQESSSNKTMLLARVIAVGPKVSFSPKPNRQAAARRG